MSEIYNKRYIPVGEATFGHKVLSQVFIPAADMAVGVPIELNDLIVNFQGFSRQGFTLVGGHLGGGAPTLDIEFQEWVPATPDESDPFTGNGTWATKTGLGIGSANPDELFEHNGEDIIRWARVLLTPRVAVMDQGVNVVISARRDT